MAKKTFKKDSLSALIYILIGALFCIFEAGVLNWLMTIVGALLVIKGIIDALGGNLTGGIINALIGAAIIILGWTLVNIVLLVLGVMLIFKSVPELISALKKKNTMDIISSAVMVALGVLLLFGNVLDALVTLIGILFIVEGVIVLIKK